VIRVRSRANRLRVRQAFVVASRALTADAAGCAGFVVSIGLLAAEN